MSCDTSLEEWPYEDVSYLPRRNIFLVLDFSLGMMDIDFKPTRKGCMLKSVRKFLKKAFAGNTVQMVVISVLYNQKVRFLKILYQWNLHEREWYKNLFKLDIKGDTSFTLALASMWKQLELIKPFSMPIECIFIMEKLYYLPHDYELNMAILKEFIEFNVGCTIISMNTGVGQGQVLKNFYEQHKNGKFFVGKDEATMKKIMLNLAINSEINFLKEKHTLIPVQLAVHHIFSGEKSFMCPCHSKENKNKNLYNCYQCGCCEARYCTAPPPECASCFASIISPLKLVQQYRLTMEKSSDSTN